MQPGQQKPTRKKFIWWGATLVTAIAAVKWLPRIQKVKEPQTTKMLTQDGKLVEIDKKLLAKASKKISNEELQQWIKK
jgi:hypothetical protein